MLKRMSLRLRITLVSVLLLLVCCIGLSVLINLSAYRMVDVVEAVPILPALSAEELPPVVGEGAAIMQPATVSQLARTSFLWQSVCFVVLVVLLGGLLTYFISARALRPLATLSEEMKKRTVHNLAERLPLPPSGDEIASLTRSFNDMSAKLDEGFSMQQRFSQSAAHELRTPLAVLKTKLEVFYKKPERSREEYDALLALVGLQTDRLAALCKDLLDLSSLDVVEKKDRVSMEVLLGEISTELAELAEKKGLQLVLDCPSLSFTGNRSLLHRAFYNLVENAIHHSPIEGKIVLAGQRTAGKVIVSVCDEGPGIPAAQRALIFEPFYRIDQSRARHLGGAGLGLATTKSILDQHGACINVRDNPAGGSIFVVSLPLP